jgi:hypothetical protein
MTFPEYSLSTSQSWPDDLLLNHQAELTGSTDLKKPGIGGDRLRPLAERHHR